MTETLTLTVSTDLTTTEVAALLLDEHDLYPVAAAAALTAAWPASMGDEAVAEWWLGFFSAWYDARFGPVNDTYVTDEEAADAEFPFFAGYRAAATVVAR
jgi:hypothetical protein